MVYVNARKDILMMKMINAYLVKINKDFCIVIAKMENVEMEY